MVSLKKLCWAEGFVEINNLSEEIRAKFRWRAIHTHTHTYNCKENMATEASVKRDFQLVRRILSSFIWLTFASLSLSLSEWVFLVFDIAFWWVCCVGDRERHIKMCSLNKKKIVCAHSIEHERSIFRCPWDIYTEAGNWSHYYTIISISNCGLWKSSFAKEYCYFCVAFGPFFAPLFRHFTYFDVMCLSHFQSADGQCCCHMNLWCFFLRDFKSRALPRM